MTEYHKINTLFKRDDKTKKLIPGEWCDPALEYLQDNEWIFTEKVDGTNIRIIWDGERIRWGGRTENAQIPTFLLSRLEDLFNPPAAERKSVFAHSSVVLYGEGYGPKINSGGNYRKDVDFVLFDVTVGGLWLERENVEGIAKSLGLDIVPIIGKGILDQAVSMTANGFKSTWGDFIAEGIVARPSTELQDRRGNRIITKIKHKDFA